jgi:multicomponent Na+:H+ antiporter subunit E
VPFEALNDRAGQANVPSKMTTRPASPAPSAPKRLARLAAWAGALGGAWWALTEGRPGSLVVGLPSVLAAAALATWLVPWPERLVRPLPALRLAGWFAWQSVRGGLDVARRALSPSLPIDPQLVTLSTRLPPGAARVLLADATSLLPGTLSVDLEDDRVLVHALAGGPEVIRDFRALEARIATLLGLPAPEGP